MQLPAALAVLLRRAEVFPGVQEVGTGRVDGWVADAGLPLNASLVHDALQCREWGAVPDAWSYDADCCAVLERADGHEGARCERGQLVARNYTCATSAGGVASQSYECLDLPNEGLVHNGAKCKEWGYPLPEAWNADADCCAWVRGRHDGQLGAGCDDGYKLEILPHVCASFAGLHGDSHDANSYLCLGERGAAHDPQKCFEWASPVPQMWNYDDDCCAWIYGRSDGKAGARCGDNYDLKVLDDICYEYPTGAKANKYECTPRSEPQLSDAPTDAAGSGAAVSTDASEAVREGSAASGGDGRFEQTRGMRGVEIPEGTAAVPRDVVKSVFRGLMKEADDTCFYDYPSCEPYCLANCTQGSPGTGFLGACMPRLGAIYSHGAVGCYVVMDPHCITCMLSPTMYPQALKRLDKCPQTRCAFAPDNAARPEFHARNASDAALKLGDFDPQNDPENGLHVGPTARPFAVRYTESRSCFQGEWSMRQGVTEAEAGCDALDRDQCKEAGACLWRTASPDWFNDMRHVQTARSVPYLR